ncbi:MAG: DNA-processing protein DprA [Calditrichia bacterium]
MRGMMPDQPPKIDDILYLLTIPNIGPGRIRRLLQVFPGVAELMKAPLQRLVQVEGIDYKTAAQLKSGGDYPEVEKQLRLMDKHQVQYVTLWDAHYPELLKRIPDPPVVLFYRGELKRQHKNSIAVVGTRTPSNYGKLAATTLVEELISKGITIVSGLARGIDTIAHQTALQGGGETLAVLGCGLDRIYPPENRQLFQDIPRQGAILTEYFLGVGPDAVNFPRRNRIISGLTRGTLVVEAGERSGALITALYALNHNREVFAVPGNINSPKSRGCNALIRQGAKLVQTVNDILEELSDLAQEEPAREKPIPAHLSDLEKKILSKLNNEPIHIDRLVMILQESPAVILSGLLTLELLGLARQLAGKMFVRA